MRLFWRDRDGQDGSGQISRNHGTFGSPSVAVVVGEASQSQQPPRRSRHVGIRPRLQTGQNAGQPRPLPPGSHTTPEILPHSRRAAPPIRPPGDREPAASPGRTGSRSGVARCGSWRSVGKPRGRVGAPTRLLSLFSPKEQRSRVLTGDSAVPPSGSVRRAAGMRRRGGYGVVVECLYFVLVLWYT